MHLNTNLAHQLAVMNGQMNGLTVHKSNCLHV